MPFGLMNAPAVFQALVNDVLHDMLNPFICTSMISTSSLATRKSMCHMWGSHVENKLFVKAEKCEFHVPSVTFLWFIIEQGQVKSDPSKVKAVAEWPTTTTRKQLQCFLGFRFYRWFMRNYSNVAPPLTQLISTASLHLNLPTVEGVVYRHPQPD